MDMVAGRVWADERRPIRHVDWFLLLLTGALVVVGLFLLYSATASTLRGESLDPFVRVKKQAITAILGLVIVW
jgi:Bacterial cell division membrane protein